MSAVTVNELWVYPFKSCAGFSVNEWPVTETGFELDREFMLVDERDRFITQRTKGAEKLARVTIGISADSLSVTAPGFGTLEAIPTEYDPNLDDVPTEVHSRPCVGKDLGMEPSRFFSRYLGLDNVRVLRASREAPRLVRPTYQRDDATNRVAFGDSFPFLLTSYASLQQQHEDAGLPYVTVPMSRFRPNIVIDGDLPPYIEDKWKRIRIGNMDAFVVRACDRCQIPNIIQTGFEAGKKGSVKVKADFLKSRKGIDLVAEDKPKGRFFGQNLNHILDTESTSLRVGDFVVVESAGESNIKLAA